MKTAALCLLSAACAVLITMAVYRWHPHREKRVFVTYSEKYVDRTIGREQEYEHVQTAAADYAEEQLASMTDRKRPCIVLTRNSTQADYKVDIAVSRFMGDPTTYGEATLTIIAKNGDVVHSEHFYQDQTSTDDIAQQPIKQAWETLCKP